MMYTFIIDNIESKSLLEQSKRQWVNALLVMFRI